MKMAKTSEFNRADSAQQKRSSNASYSDSWTMTFVKGEHKSRLKRNGNRNSQTPVAKSCTLHLVADYLFFTQVGGSDVMTTANVMKDTVRDADAIFRSTDFDQDGVGDNIGFLVINITVLRNYPSQYFPYSLYTSDPQQYLRNFSRVDHSKVCLAVVFTYLNFERSVGGVAWAASSSPAASPGGLCQLPVYVDKEAAHFSFNTIVVTFRTGGKTVRRDMAVRFLLHELGHSFGSTHDGDSSSDSCRLTSGSKVDGAFMMSHQSTTGEMPNNYRFSPCSVRAMYPVIVHKGTCLHEHRNSQCGNGLKEDGEECDCGNSAVCPYRDACCTPSDVSQNSSDPPCTLHRSKGKTCSPLSSPCCTANCTVVRDVTRVCDVGTDCMGLSLCDGVSDECPEAPVKQNETSCGGGSRFCEGGHCTGSVCRSHALIACQCTIPVTDRCKVCCKTSNDSDCLSLETLGLTESSGQNRPLYLTAGQPCWSPKPAFCDGLHVCASISSSSTDNTKYGFYQSTSRWIVRHWLYVLGAALCVVVGVTAFRTSRFHRKNSHIKAVHYGKIMAIFRIATLLKLHIMHDIALGRYLLGRYQRKVARCRVPLHYWEAVSRLRTFFPSCPLSHIANTVTLATSEDVVVCVLLAQGFPMRRFVSKLTTSEVARCGKLSRMYNRRHSLLQLDYNFTPEHSSGSSSSSGESWDGSSSSDESSDIGLLTRGVNALHTESVSRASSTSQIGLPSLAGKYISFHKDLPPRAAPSVCSLDTQPLFLRDTVSHLMTYAPSKTLEENIYDPEYNAYLRRLKEEMQNSRKTLNTASKDNASRRFVYTRSKDKWMDTPKKGTPTEQQPTPFSMLKSVTRKKTRNPVEMLSKLTISNKERDEVGIADKKKKSREAVCASAKEHNVHQEGSPLEIAEDGTLPGKTDGAVKTKKPEHDDTYVGEKIKHSGTANFGKVVLEYWFG
ncbi:hypothetical protein V1264_000030 [Littorina saxatilis]|uniref:Disintegrin and metalloproteinase domain-containing protein 10 n=2 Tax=Littorina saxatilis TaxID=31220 RepID=A0AAN9GMM7_9CAEN